MKNIYVIDLTKSQFSSFLEKYFLPILENKNIKYEFFPYQNFYTFDIEEFDGDFQRVLIFNNVDLSIANLISDNGGICICRNVLEESVSNEHIFHPIAKDDFRLAKINIIKLKEATK